MKNYADYIMVFILCIIFLEFIYIYYSLSFIISGHIYIKKNKYQEHIYDYDYKYSNTNSNISYSNI